MAKKIKLNRKPTINNYTAALKEVERMARTPELFPVLKDAPKLRAPKYRTSADYVRKLTFDVTGHHTHHTTDNLEILRVFINGCWKRKNDVEIPRELVNLSLGRIYFGTHKSKDFRVMFNMRDGKVTAEQFESKIKTLIRTPLPTKKSDESSDK